MDLPFGKSFRFVKERLDRTVLASGGKCGGVRVSRNKGNGWNGKCGR